LQVDVFFLQFLTCRLKPCSGVKRLDASRSGDQSAPAVGKRAPASGGVVPDKAEAFEEFKTQDGAEVNRQLKENVNAFKDKKLVQKELATKINAVKLEIDAIQSQVPPSITSCFLLALILRLPCSSTRSDAMQILM
jgi:hypothetical protein